MRRALPVAALAIGLSFVLALTVVAQTSETFGKAKLNVQDGEKTKSVDAIVRYDADALVVVDKKGASLKSMPYVNMKGAEYSYAKSPRWKTAIFVSPLFLFTSGKKHWFMVQGEGDYAVLQLDKSNYRMVLGAFESKTGKTVELVEDNK